MYFEIYRTLLRGVKLLLRIIYVLDWTLVGTNLQCRGSEVRKGRLKKVDECYLACLTVSSMFIYGTKSKCNNNGCNCWCQTSARSNGTCLLTPTQDYKLYKHENLIKGKYDHEFT